MKKILLLLIALVLVFSSCSGKTETFEEIKGYDTFGNQSKDKPSSGNYFIYTPIIDIFTPEFGDEVSFLDFDGTKFVMDSGTDKAFLISYDLMNGKSENLTKNLGFHSESVFSDGEDYYCIDNDGFEYFLVHKNSAGETIEVIRTRTEEAEYPEDYVLPEVDFDFFCSGEKIILIKNYENGSLSTFCYDTENREIVEHHKNSAVSGHETIPTNGYITYVEEKDGLYTIYSLEPENEKREKKGPSVPEKVLSSAFDGKCFVWSTESGIYYKPVSEKAVQISEKGGMFAFLGRNFVLYSTGEKLVLYRIDKNFEGGFNDFSGLEFVYANENVAVFKNPEGIFGEKYLSVSIRRGEEPLRLADAADEAPFTVAVDGYTYYCFFEGSGGVVPTEKQISGKITSAWCDSSTCPRKNDQSNDSFFLGARYAFVDGELLLENINGKGWYKCKKSRALSEMDLD